MHYLSRFSCKSSCTASLNSNFFWETGSLVKGACLSSSSTDLSIMASSSSTVGVESTSISNDSCPANYGSRSRHSRSRTGSCSRHCDFLVYVRVSCQILVKFWGVAETHIQQPFPIKFINYNARLAMEKTRERAVEKIDLPMSYNWLY